MPAQQGATSNYHVISRVWQCSAPAIWRWLRNYRTAPNRNWHLVRTPKLLETASSNTLIFLTNTVYLWTVAGLPLVVRIPQFEKPWYSLCDDTSLAGLSSISSILSSYLKTERAGLLIAAYILVSINNNHQRKRFHNYFTSMTPHWKQKK
jgi:hypothetical protein